MGRTARFRVHGRMDGAAEATVLIDRDAGVITVRPLRRRKEYTLPLATVAEMVIWRFATAEARKRAGKRGAP